MKRGDLVTVALQGDYGKPRPGLVIQADLFADHPSCTILPISGDLREAPLFRITVEPNPDNGLRVCPGSFSYLTEFSEHEAD